MSDPPSNTKSPAAPAAPRGKCPICGAPRSGEYNPFCSRRCADVDLHRWLGGAYAVPGNPVDEDGNGESESLPASDDA